MTIYRKSNNHRKIYENHHGSIPKDSEGRTYEIHHIDGNHSNNDPSNLKAVTIKEHYDIHYSQKDWAACVIMSKRMNLSPEETSRMASLAAIKRNNTEGYVNPFSKKEDGSSMSSVRSKNGTHQYLKRNDGTSLSSDRVKNGTHNFITNHPNKKNVTCSHCGLVGGSTNMKRFHFKNCWLNPNKNEITRELFNCECCNVQTNKGNYKRWHGINCKYHPHTNSKWI